MLNQRWHTELLILSVVTGLLGCANSGLDSIQVTPATQALQVGQTAQFVAVGTYGSGSHPSTAVVTTGVTWASSAPAVASVNAITGLATALGAGTTSISANAAAYKGNSTSSANLTVTGTGVVPPNTLTSITILPGSQPVNNIGETSQFIAIGSYSGSPATQDLTNQVTWGSSNIFVATINASGLATTVSTGITTVTALYTTPATQSVVSAIASLTSGSNQGIVTLPTLTVYKVGATASAAIVTASYTLPGSSTIVAAFNCAAGAPAPLCTGSFPVGVTVTLTTPNTGATPAFGGWSSNCLQVVGNPYACTVTMSVPPAQTSAIGNVTVGAIFD